MAILTVDGGEVTVNGKSADVLGVSPQAFRSWTSPQTAAAAAVWTDLAQGRLVGTRAAASRLHLAAGHSAQVSAAVQARVPFGAQTVLSVPGVDAVVDQARSAPLGLVRNVAVLINAPGTDLAKLMAQVRSVTGPGGQVRNLVPYTAVSGSKLPVTTNVPTTGVPKSLVTLYQQSAKEYCPGLSWTVLAAINEIESGDGANEGPSSAGALRPMQFLPSTWAEWGIDAFGQTGPPDIMNPLDAVPSAARLLCAAGRREQRVAFHGDLRLQPRDLVRRRGARACQRIRPGLSLADPQQHGRSARRDAELAGDAQGEAPRAGYLTGQ